MAVSRNLMIREAMIEHAVQPINSDQWQRIQQRSASDRQTGKTKKFWLSNRNVDSGFIVGSEVRDTVTPRKGVTKYESGYIEAYIIAGMLDILPDGHDNILLAVGHPPNAINYLDNMFRAVAGVHRVTLPNGNKVVYKIRYVKPYDENAGGIVRALSQVDKMSQTPELARLEVGQQVLITDIGGRIGSMYLATLGDNYRPEIHFDDGRGRAFEFGVEDIKRELNDKIRAFHNDLFEWDIDNLILEDCLRQRGHGVQVGENDVNMVDAYNQAITPFLNKLNAIYKSDMKGARTARVIFNTGGGSGALYHTLDEDVYGRSCVLVDTYSEIQMANMRGIAYSFWQWAKHAQDEPRFDKLFSSGDFALLIADAGNSALKIGMI